jgi:hypothetical protein
MEVDLKPVERRAVGGVPRLTAAGRRDRAGSGAHAHRQGVPGVATAHLGQARQQHVSRSGDRNSRRSTGSAG